LAGRGELSTEEGSERGLELRTSEVELPLESSAVELSVSLEVEGSGLGKRSLRWLCLSTMGLAWRGELRTEAGTERELVLGPSESELSLESSRTSGRVLSMDVQHGL
jgi:hypothetical protein